MIVKFIQWEWNAQYCVFSSEEYLSSQSSNYGWIGGYIENKLVVVLPFLLHRRFRIKYIFFPSDIIKLSPNDNLNVFYECLISFLENKKFSFIAQQPPQAFSSILPFGVISVPFGSYRVNLLQSEQDLWNNLHVKHRNVIRNAIKAGVRVESDSKDYDVLFKLLRETMSRSNLNFLSRSEFRRYMLRMEGKQVAFISYYQGTPQGCAIVPFSKHAAYYSYGGSISKPLTGSINFLHWEAMLYFKMKEVRIYDFVGARINPIIGSKQEGIQRFKSRFGGELVVGFLWKKPLNKFEYNLFRFLQKIKKGTFKYNHDIIDQELDR